MEKKKSKVADGFLKVFFGLCMMRERTVIISSHLTDDEIFAALETAIAKSGKVGMVSIK